MRKVRYFWTRLIFLLSQETNLLNLNLNHRLNFWQLFDLISKVVSDHSNTICSFRLRIRPQIDEQIIVEWTKIQWTICLSHLSYSDGNQAWPVVGMLEYHIFCCSRSWYIYYFYVFETSLLLSRLSWFTNLPQLASLHLRIAIRGRWLQTNDEALHHGTTLGIHLQLERYLNKSDKSIRHWKCAKDVSAFERASQTTTSLPLNLNLSLCLCLWPTSDA